MIDVKELARGGEAIVYRVDHTGSDEIVVKTPLFGENPSVEKVMACYDSIFYESQTLMLNNLKSHICKIKEEIINFNP